MEKVVCICLIIQREPFFSEQGADVLYALMDCLYLVDATNSFKGTPEMRFTISEQSGVERSTMSKWVYVFQKEYATVDPALVDVIFSPSLSLVKMLTHEFQLCPLLILLLDN